MEGARAFVGTALSIVLFFTACFSRFPLTPAGIHCPTASVQTVTDVVYERNCCGKLVAKTVVRKPVAGETTFKQCQCAEKKASTSEQSKAQEMGSAICLGIVPSKFLLPPHVPIFESGIHPGRYLGIPSERPQIPHVPPPQRV